MKKYQMYNLLFMILFSIPLFASGSKETSSPEPSSSPSALHDPSNKQFFILGTVYKQYKGQGEQYPLDGILLIVTQISTNYKYETYTDPSGNFIIYDYPGDNEFGEYTITLYIGKRLLGTTDNFHIKQNSTEIIVLVDFDDKIKISVKPLSPK